MNRENKDTLRFVFALAHLIMYLNSALNPLIYNFFSGEYSLVFIYLVIFVVLSSYLGQKQKKQKSVLPNICHLYKTFA